MGLHGFRSWWSLKQSYALNHQLEVVKQSRFESLWTTDFDETCQKFSHFMRLTFVDQELILDTHPLGGASFSPVAFVFGVDP